MTTTYVPFKGGLGDSDLGGTGFNDQFAKRLVTSGYSSESESWTISTNTTEKSSAWTEPGEPSAAGATGDFTVECNVTTGNTDAYLSIQIHRVNSAGTIQNSSSVSSEQQATAGLKTFTFSAQSLGTWASGDRLRVDYWARNASTMTTANISIEHGTTSAEVIAPWPVAGGNTSAMFAVF